MSDVIRTPEGFKNTGTPANEAQATDADAPLTLSPGSLRVVNGAAPAVPATLPPGAQGGSITLLVDATSAGPVSVTPDPATTDVIAASTGDVATPGSITLAAGTVTTFTAVRDGALFRWIPQTSTLV